MRSGSVLPPRLGINDATDSPDSPTRIESLTDVGLRLQPGFEFLVVSGLLHQEFLEVFPGRPGMFEGREVVSTDEGLIRSSRWRLK